MKIKICCVTNVSDAEFVDQLGADFIGLIFAEKSPRKIDLATAKKIVACLKHAKPIGVFTKKSADEIQTYVDALKLFAVQLYAPPEKKIQNALYIQALAVKNKADLEVLKTSTADYILLDAYHATAEGGTGKKFDWSLLPPALDKVFLAGGITPENISAAMKLKPFAIDICSGVEKSPGIKDREKLKKLFSEIQKC